MIPVVTSTARRARTDGASLLVSCAGLARLSMRPRTSDQVDLSLGMYVCTTRRPLCVRYRANYLLVLEGYSSVLHAPP